MATAIAGLAGNVELTSVGSSLFERPPGAPQSPDRPMSTVLDFDEKKFWIALFSIVARREAARESIIREHLASKLQLQPKKQTFV
jgi:hypothetical protein